MATVMTTTFELVGADGGPLRGDVRTQSGGAERPAVVVCHGFKGFKNWGFFPKLADRLAHGGLTAVSFNFTGSGIGPDGESFSEPERFGHATFSRDLEDLDTVCRELSAGTLAGGVARPTKLGLFGHSRGGGMAVAHAAAHHDIAALTTWAGIGTVRRWPEEVVAQWRQDGKIDVPNARTGGILPLYTDVLDDIDEHEAGKLDLLEAAGRIRVPWLIMHGDADETVSLAEAQSFHDAATGDEVRLHIVPGGSHTMGSRHPWSGSTPELDLAMGETVGWFAKYLF
jgi:dienelactone hydrolase